MAALAVALDGICEIWTPGGAERRLRAVDFIIGPQQNALRTGELLRAVFLPDETLRRRTAFRQISLTPQGRSAALLLGTLSQTGSFSLTVTAATRQPIHLDFQTVPSGSDLNAALIEAIPDTQYYDDLHGPPFWRRKMTFRLAEQILRELDGTVSE
jgi:CO/xanthine dehydrogenase FAD-binding subunit